MTIGIYAIYNRIDNKIYVGKSKNIEKRIKGHFAGLRSEYFNSKTVNRYLFNAFKKHGEENFKWKILHAIDELDEVLLSELELHYMDLYQSYNQEFGYNLRRDSSTGMIVHEQTRLLISENNMGENNPNYGNNWSDAQKKRMSDIKKQQFADGVYDFMKTEKHRKFLSESSTNLWKDEEKRAIMAEKVALAKSELRFYQYCKITGELVATWESMHDILKEHPDYHRIAIYSVCNGHKKSYRGFIWKSELKGIESSVEEC